MSNFKRLNNRGFSLVELIIAIGLGISILAGLFMILANQFHFTTTSSVRHKVNEKFDIAQNMIRYEAMGNYHAMSRTNQLMSVAVYPEIETRVTINDEDPATKTRTAILVASYLVGRGENKQVEISTRVFAFGNSYGSGTGAAIEISVKREGTNNGVEGIYVETQGEGTPTVSGTTGPDGKLILFGVKESSPNIRLDLNAYARRCYFPSGTGGTFTTSVYPPGGSSAITQSGQAPLLFDDVFVQMPGAVEGVVRDAGSPASPQPGVPNMSVQLYPMQVPVGNLGAPLDPNPVPGQSGPGGVYRFHRVIPGIYYLLVRGGTDSSGTEWVAADMPGSTGNNYMIGATAWMGGPFPGRVLVISSATTNVDLLTIRTGRLHGVTRTLQANALVPNTFDLITFPPAHDASITFFTKKNETYTPNAIVGPTNYYVTGLPFFLWTGLSAPPLHGFSIVGNDWFVLYNSQNGYETVNSDGGGNYEFANKWPQVVSRDAGHPMSSQSYEINPFFQHIMPDASNASPVGVVMSGGNIKFHVRAAEGGFSYLPRESLAPNGIAGEDDFKINIFTNFDVPAQNQKTIMFLDRNAFASVSGTLTTDGMSADQWDEAVLETVYSGNATPLVGSGFLVGGPSGWSIDGDYLMPLTPPASLSAVPAVYSFDTRIGSQKMLIPNLGTDRQSIIARFSSLPQTVNGEFRSPVIGLVKPTAASTFYPAMNSTDVDLQNVSFTATAIGSPAQVITDTLEIVDGQFGPPALTNQPVTWQERREIVIGPYAYRPGEAVTGLSIPVTSGTPNPRTYRVVLAPEAGSGWRSVRNNWNDPWRIFEGAFVGAVPGNILYQPINPATLDTHTIPTFLVEAFFKLRGNVRRVDNNAPVLGADVRVSGANLAAVTVQTDINGDFDFTPNSNDYLVVTPLVNQDSIFLLITPPINTSLQPLEASAPAWQSVVGPSGHMPDQVVNVSLSEQPSGGGLTGGSF